MWQPSSHNKAVTGYEGYRAGEKAAEVPVTAWMTDIDGLTASTAYSFTVRARDASDTSSPDSDALDLTTESTPGAPASTAPTDLRTKTAADGKQYVVDLSWDQPDTGGEIRRTSCS